MTPRTARLTGLLPLPGAPCPGLAGAGTWFGTTDAAGPPAGASERELIAVFSAGEQQELRQIEQGLRADDRRFAGRLAARQGILRWAAPGRQRFLLVLAVAAVLAAVLLASVAVAARSLASAVRAALSPDLSVLLIIGAKGRPGWDPGRARSGTRRV